MQKQLEKSILVALKKNYSVLTSALRLTISKEGKFYDWANKNYRYTPNNAEEEIDYVTINIDKFIDNLQILKDCGHEAKGCFKYRYKRVNGTDERDFENLAYYRKVVLNDGTLIAAQGYPISEESTSRGEIWVDVNGYKKPNKVGSDLFLFVLKDNGTLEPYGFKSLKEDDAKPEGYNAAAWALFIGNLDYLHCSGLSWNGKHSC